MRAISSAQVLHTAASNNAACAQCDADRAQGAAGVLLRCRLQLPLGAARLLVHTPGLQRWHDRLGAFPSPQVRGSEAGVVVN